MNFFSTNIRLLRNRREVTQDMVARSLEVTRSTVNSLENGSIKNPTVVMLVKLSDYYKVSIDALIKIDLSTMNKFQLFEFMQYQKTNSINGTR